MQTFNYRDIPTEGHVVDEWTGCDRKWINWAFESNYERQQKKTTT